MQANLEAATTDRQALENSKAETARTQAAALEQLAQSTKQQLEETQSSVAALREELRVAPPPSRCRPSDPNSH